ELRDRVLATLVMRVSAVTPQCGPAIPRNRAAGCDPTRLRQSARLDLADELTQRVAQSVAGPIGIEYRRGTCLARQYRPARTVTSSAQFCAQHLTLIDKAGLIGQRPRQHDRRSALAQSRNDGFVRFALVRAKISIFAVVIRLGRPVDA